MPTLMKMTIVPMVYRMIVSFEMVQKHIHRFPLKLYILNQ